MAIIIDADVVIRGEKGQFDLKSWLSTNGDQSFEVASITVAELWHGIERADARHRAKRELYVRTILESVSVVPYTAQTAFEHARICARLEATGKMAGPYDLIVAATALERGSAVATFNLRHFENVQGLDLIEPKLP
jgi:tRNA(fMet)-specific endonuclease VapC